MMLFPDQHRPTPTADVLRINNEHPILCSDVKAIRPYEVDQIAISPLLRSSFRSNVVSMHWDTTISILQR
jgi:hypothetical protein